MSQPSFPPLFSGQDVAGSIDPFDKAITQATLGCEAGVIVYNLAADELRAALVLVPEVPLKDAMAMLPACGIGFQNALGALAPPEVAVHLEWDGGLRINGASCGRLRVAASGNNSEDVPDWLVVGLELPLLPLTEDTGDTPDKTALYAEGCADVNAAQLLESWAKHTLVWINRWDEQGAESLHAEWRGLGFSIGEEITMGGKTGIFLGVDERFGMLLRTAENTELIPMTTLLEQSA
jgi:biotin-(acetyl-CoA carboxylase) ligase